MWEKKKVKICDVLHLQYRGQLNITARETQRHCELAGLCWHFTTGLPWLFVTEKTFV